MKHDKRPADARARHENPSDDELRGDTAAEEALQGPPARETTIIRDDRERAAEAHREDYHATSPRLTGGDPDADWERADSVGEEAVGGTVATPDQSVVDDLGSALGVPRAPDDEVRTSGEILDERDRNRWEQEIGGDA
jgi:hypothetical protein